MMSAIQAIRAELQAIVTDEHFTSEEKRQMIREIIDEAQNALDEVE